MFSTEFWNNLGRALIKIVVACFAGVGVGLIVVGMEAQADPHFWTSHQPPTSILTGVGSGFLTTAGLLVFFFFLFESNPKKPTALRDQKCAIYRSSSAS